MRTIAYLLLLVINIQPVFGQSNTLCGEITYTHPDNDKKTLLDSVLVTIVNISTKDTLSVYSDQNGKYKFKDIPEGKYDVNAYFRVFDTITVRDVVVGKSYTFQDMTFKAITNPILDGVYYSSDGWLFSDAIALDGYNFRRVHMGDMGSYKSKGTFTVEYDKQQLTLSYKNRRWAGDIFKLKIKNGQILLEAHSDIYSKGLMTPEKFEKCYRRAGNK
jgi:hypothetical protein